MNNKHHPGPTCQGCSCLEEKHLNGTTYLWCPVWNLWITNKTSACGHKQVEKGSFHEFV